MTAVQFWVVEIHSKKVNAGRKSFNLTQFKSFLLFLGGKNFYRFPRTAHLQQKWISFTRQKDLDPKEAFICQDHFDQESLEKRHGIIRLGKNAIPTIGFADQPEEEEEYNPEPEVQDITNEDQEFLDEESAEEHPVKLCCRLCGETKELNYPTKELESLGIDVDNLFKFLELNTDYNSYLSEIICEDCFLVVSPLGAFKQRCKEAEVKMLLDLGFIEEQQIQETVENSSEICEEYLDGEDSTDQQETEMINQHILPDQEVELEKTSLEQDTSEPEPKKARVQKITKRSLLYECTLCKAVSILFSPCLALKFQTL